MSTPITSISQLDPNGTYTYADYLTWQFTELVELLRGKIMRRMSAPTDRHQALVGSLFLEIGSHLRRSPCQVRVAPYDVRLPKRGSTADEAIYTVVQPDVCVICDPSKIEPRGCLGAPDLIIEVASPRTAARDWKDKFDLYEEAGVGEGGGDDEEVLGQLGERGVATDGSGVVDVDGSLQPTSAEDSASPKARPTAAMTGRTRRCGIG